MKLIQIIRFLKISLTLLQHAYSSSFWECEKIKLPRQSVKFLFQTLTYGQYMGSCLRSDSNGGLHVYCQRENLCGTNFKNQTSEQMQQLFSNFQQKRQKESYKCEIFSSVGGQRCDELERDLISTDANDCAEVFCEAEGTVCVDHFGYYECVNRNGLVLCDSLDIFSSCRCSLNGPLKRSRIIPASLFDQF